MGTEKTTKITCPCCPKMPVPVPFLAGFQNHVPMPMPFSPQNGRAHVPLARALTPLDLFSLTEFPQKSHRSCKKMWKVSMRWKVTGFYDTH